MVDNVAEVALNFLLTFRQVFCAPRPLATIPTLLDHRKHDFSIDPRRSCEAQQ